MRTAGVGSQWLTMEMLRAELSARRTARLVHYQINSLMPAHGQLIRPAVGDNNTIPSFAAWDNRTAR